MSRSRMTEHLVGWINDPIITSVHLMYANGKVAVQFGDTISFHFSDPDYARVVVGNMELDPSESFCFHQHDQPLLMGSDGRAAVLKWIQAGHRDQK